MLSVLNIGNKDQSSVIKLITDNLQIKEISPE